ncbi:MAG: hypothetical protein LBK08_01820 [Treponema sp.]|jgi:hypothetical protein|nr:hypothetical protein [Treponema sp.]
MKKEILALTGPWLLRERGGKGPLLAEELESLPGQDWLEGGAPLGVHEILLRHGRIADPRTDNNCAAVQWVAESDWLYRYTFKASPPGKKHRLVFEALDTWVDIYLGSEKIASSADMFLPVEVDVPFVRAGDVLTLHFSAPQRMYDTTVMPSEWEGSVNKLNVIRKSKHDFTQFGGQNPYMALTGPCGEIRLESWDEARLEYAGVNVRMEGNDGVLEITPEISGEARQFSAVLVDDATGAEAGSQSGTGDPIVLRIPGVKRWNPRGYGEQNMYRLEMTLYADGEAVDTCEKSIGFRTCSIDENLNTVINGQRVRMWGACLTPIDGMTHTWNQPRFERLLDLAENAHMNILRVWGGGFPLPDSMYEACDRRGVLVWQDFIHDYGMYPFSEEYTRIFLAEAASIVKRLKHHPCIALWCGGNETFLGAEYVMPERPFLGGDLYTKHYRELCERLDPGRYYHVNSPYGGSCANDPSEGDTHSYSHDWYVPGLAHPVFPSENNRAGTPCLATMEKMLGKGLWPEDFRDQWTFRSHPMMPDTWKRWMVPAVTHESGDLHNFYEAENAAQLIYKFGASARDHIRSSVECCRRGKPEGDPSLPFRSNGHMIWKLNDTWPSIYCGAIDYYLLPNMSYYALKRAYQPVILSFENGDRIRLWVVNDTMAPVEAKLRVRVFDLIGEKYTGELLVDVRVAANDSAPVSDLAPLGQIRRTSILAAELAAPGGKIIDEKVQLLDVERRLDFRGAELKAEPSPDGGWMISANHYCQCVCLRGKTEDGGEAVFTDNYFHLLPDHTRTVYTLNGKLRDVVARDAYCV